MKIEARWILRTGAVLGFLGVALGAFGAHALEAHLEATGRAGTWETAVLYHLVHAVALVALAGLRLGEASRRGIGLCWAAGTVVFSGSLYLLCLTNTGWLGAITPLGGVAFLAGWIWLTLGRDSAA